MAQKEVDSITGTETTGHEWDGLKELNTPLPKWWLYVFYATILFSAVYVVVMPSLPGLPGVIGFSSRERLLEDLTEQRQDRAVWLDQVESKSVDEIEKDPELLQFAMAGGRTVFADNCAPCHGSGGAGTPGFPILADDNWIWGGTLNDIETTVLHGIRNDQDPDARVSEMPAFGADGILDRAQISAVADYVLSLSGDGAPNAEGKELFEENCAACHGEDGKGNKDLGAPNLTDQIWLYGGGKEAIERQIEKPRLGVMPAWAGRLDNAEIKEVTIYVHSLGGGQ